jgi:hypothetical protein
LECRLQCLSWAQKRALAKRIIAVKAYLEEHSRLNDEAQTKARVLIDEAVTNGAAKPIDR